MGLPYWSGVVISGVVILFYTSVGGYLAVVWTSFVQALVMIAALVLLTFMSLKKVGGMTALVDRLNNVDPGLVNTPGVWGWAGLISFTLIVSLGTWGMPQLLVRFYSIKNDKMLRLGTVIVTVGASVAMLPYLTGAIAHAMLDIPGLKGRVNDYAGMLSSAAIQSLESELKGFEQTDSTQIVVLTVPSLEGEAIEDFSIRVAEAWKIGHRGSDNGAILVIAQKDRKMRIEVGYGLEGRLTDLVSGQIIRNVIAPEFKAGDYDKGVLDGINAMIATVRGEYKQADRQHLSTGAKDPSQVLIPIIVFLFLVTRLGRIRRLVGSIAGGILLPVFGLMFFPGGLMLLLALIPLGFFAGFDSPVRIASLHAKPIASINLRSAGTRSPDAITTTSPGTKS